MFATKKTAKLTKDAIAECDKNIAATTTPKKGKAPKGKTPATAKPKSATKPASAPKPKGPKRMSGLDAAAKILGAAKEPMGCKAIAERARAQKLWTPAGKTPHATLYSAIIREIAKKGAAGRFKKASRGHFELRTAKKGA